ncbi:alanine racemase [Cohnella silvisoli]|uniref:Alanine racemase n=1 Tax=Cohnella silvisoli TaxID=2873699 RepID=A0ABV1KY69_9BACL|nr:alanine racemase [Cohnella silvisoli]MCD9026535.1 alanine racemase [Cohnella silvisoli]
MEPSEIYRDTWAEVDLSCISHNLKVIKSRLPAPAEFMAVVKANGYGHGDREIAEIAVQAGADSLAVAYLSEAINLRRQGITAPILILTPIQPQEVPIALKHRFMLTVTNAGWLEQMRAYKSANSRDKLRIHIKFDTGLGRIGLREREEWDAMVPRLKQPDIEVAGIFTHLATAGNVDIGYSKAQAAKFQQMLGWVKESGVKVRQFHCANSAAALRFPEMVLDNVRVGAALYGFYAKEHAPDLQLRPALSLHSRLIHVKRVNKGQYIGYDNSYRAAEDEWIGTVPIGYADGWSQSLQGSEMLVDVQRAPIVGKIGMDQLMIRLPRSYPVNTLVTLIGKQMDEQITCAELAAHLGSVPQEISTSLSSRIPRLYKGHEIVTEMMTPVTSVHFPNYVKKEVKTKTRR